MSVYGNVLLERVRWTADNKIAMKIAKEAKAAINKSKDSALKNIKSVAVSDYHGASINVTVKTPIDKKDFQNTYNKCSDIVKGTIKEYENKEKKKYPKGIDCSYNLKVSTEDSFLIVIDCMISYEN